MVWLMSKMCTAENTAALDGCGERDKYRASDSWENHEKFQREDIAYD